jgi:hypothetical protein
VLFEKGKSANPGGRTKKDIEIEAHSRLYAKRAIDVAVEIMNDKEAFKGDRLRAAQFIVDRAYGKPREQLNVTHDKPISERTEAELEAIIIAGRSGNGIAKEEAVTSKPH